MNIFRRLIGSRFGGVFALAFLGLIAFAFVAGDLSNQSTSSMFGGGSSEALRVGKQKISTTEVQTRAQQVFERIRERQPDYTIDKFIAEGGLDQVIEGIISSRAIVAYGEKNGFRISKALVDAEIARIPAFADASGKFNEAQFRAMLNQRGIQESALRADITAQLMEQQLISPATIGAQVPATLAPPYARMLLEKRSGEAIVVPSVRFAPNTAPADSVLRAYYTQNAAQFSVPERRKLRYMLVDRARFEASAKPTEAEIAAAYKTRAAEFAARDSRSFTQLIVPTEAAAKDIAGKLASGGGLDAAAKAAGLSASKVTDVDKAAFTGQSSADIANAAFGAARGTLVGPLKSPLGWTLLHVDEVRSVPARTLDQVRDTLVPELAKVKAAQAFSDYLSEIDGQIGEGATFAEIARARGLQIVETPSITAQGNQIGDPAYKADATVTALLKPGFAMGADDDPQIAPVTPDQVAAIVAVAESIPAGPLPFEQSRSAVQVAWGLSQGAQKAKAAADGLAKALGSGQPLAQALAANGLAGTQVQPLEAYRREVSQNDPRVPPPLLTLFTLKQGAARVLPLTQNQGFVVVQLNRIAAPDAAEIAKVIPATQAGLKDVLGREYGEELANAARQDMGVKRNAAAIAAVTKALREANGSGEQ